MLRQTARCESLVRKGRASCHKQSRTFSCLVTGLTVALSNLHIMLSWYCRTIIARRCRALIRNCDFPKLINAIGFDLAQCTSWFLGKLSCFTSQEKYTLHVDHSTVRITGQDGLIIVHVHYTSFRWSNERPVTRTMSITSLVALIPYKTFTYHICFE